MTTPTTVPDDLWRELDPALPVVLLPVRLETRWGHRDLPDGGGRMPVLRVRIYPDEVSVVPPAGLTRQEAAAGQRFWQRHRQPPADADPADPGAVEHRQHAAWEALTREVGVDRAGPVARATEHGPPPDTVPAAEQPPAQARLLPDAWVVTGHSLGERVFTAYLDQVPESIEVGPSSAPEQPDPDHPDPAAGWQPRWLTDFAEAQRRGMAVTIDLATPEQVRAGELPAWLPHGLSTLVVFGVRGTGAGEPEAEAGRLADLLGAHAAFGDAGFLPVGTPTNDLPGRRSGWTSRPDVFAGYREVVDGPAAVPVGGTAGALRGEPGSTAGSALAAAWGLPGEVTAFLPGAADPGLVHARAMARAVFPAGFGETLRTLLLPADPAELAAEQIEAMDAVSRFAAEHVAGYVRGRGPLPVLRLGRQPYGVLPVTVLDRYAATADDPPLLPALAGLLRRLRPLWNTAAHQVPMLRDRPGELAPEWDEPPVASRLLRILGHGPVPHPGAYRLESCRVPVWPYGYPVLDHDVTAATYRALLGPLAPGEPAIAEQLGTVLAPFAVGHSPSAMELFLPSEVLVLQQAGTAEEPTDPLAVALAARPRVGPLFAGTGAEPTLLDLLRPYREGPVTGPVAATTGVLSPAGYLAALAAREELEDEPPDLLYRVVRQSLALAVQPAGPRWARWLADRRDRDHPRLRARHRDFRSEAEAYLAFVTEMQRWIAGGAVGPRPAATAEMQAQWRDWLANPTRPPAHGPALVLTSWFALRSQPDAPERPGGDPAFPETAAAVAELAEADLPGAEYARLLGETLACAGSRLDAWCTSLATRRLDTLRAARPTGVQLGCWGVVVGLPYRAPDPAPGPAGWTAPDGSTELLRLAHPVGYVHAPSLAQARTAGVMRAAERAHQGDQSTLATLDLTSGRARIARELLTALGNGQPFGAVLGDLLERALGDAGLHTRITALRQAFPPDPPDPADGGAAPDLPVAVVDGLAAWRAWRGDPDRVAERFPGTADAFAELDRAVEGVADTLVAEGVHQLVAGRTELAAATFAALEDGEPPPLGLDVLRTPGSGATLTHRVVLTLDPAAGTGGWQRSRHRAALAEPVERWAETVLGKPGGYRALVSGTGTDGSPVAEAEVGLDALGLCALDVVAEAGSDALATRLATAAGVASDPRMTDPDGSWARLLALAGALAAVLGTARPAVLADLTPEPEPDEEGTAPAAPPPDLAPVVEVLAGELAALAEAVKAAEKQLPSDLDDDQPVPDALLDPFDQLGLAAGRATAGTLRGAVAAARVVFADLDRLLGEPPDGQPDLPWRGRLAEAAGRPGGAGLLTAVARRLAGDPVVPVPPVTADLAGHLLPADQPGPGQVEEWLERTARVRDRTDAYTDLRQFVEAAGGAPEPLRVAHLPGGTDQPWLGGPQPAPLPPDGARVHLVLAGAGTGADPVSGLVLDEFDEVLPDPTVTTGLALHYDAPSARPPQSILVAVHPDPAEPWSWQLLEDTVLEALALARLRLVEPEDLAPLLPAGAAPLAYLGRTEEPWTYDWPPEPLHPLTQDEILARIRADEELAALLMEMHQQELEEKLDRMMRGEPGAAEEWLEAWLRETLGLITYPPYGYVTPEAAELHPELVVDPGELVSPATDLELGRELEVGLETGLAQVTLSENPDYLAANRLIVEEPVIDELVIEQPVIEEPF